MYRDNVHFGGTRLVTAILAVLLLLALSSCFSAVNGADVDTFSNSHSTFQMEFSDGGGEVTDVTVTMHKGEKVHNFSLGINGTSINGSFPSDLGLDVGGDGSMEWEHKGVLDGSSLINGQTVVDALNQYIPAGNSGLAPPTVLKFTSSSRGLATLFNLSITYNLGPETTAPQGTIPTQTLMEDSFASYGGLNLSNFFVDPEGDELGYTMVGNEDIVATIKNTTSLVTFSAPDNWHGIETMTVVATDSYGFTANAELTVNVGNTPDPVELVSSTPEGGTVEMVEGESQNFSVELKNVDDVQFTTIWYVNDVENPGDMSFLFTPDYRDEGARSIVFRVLDRSDRLLLSRGWIVFVENLNQKPVAVIDNPQPLGQGEGQYRADREVGLRAESSSDPDGKIVHYLWESDIDGVISNSENDMVYLSVGKHNLTLGVMDELGQRGEASVVVEVGAGKESSNGSSVWPIILVIGVIILVVASVAVGIILLRRGKKTVKVSHEESLGPRASHESMEGTTAKPSIILDQDITRKITVDENVRCEVCNSNFIRVDNAYICNTCDSLFHLDCTVAVCPDCGSDMSRCLSPVLVEKLERAPVAPGNSSTTWVEVGDFSQKVVIPPPQSQAQAQTKEHTQAQTRVSPPNVITDAREEEEVWEDDDDDGEWNVDSGNEEEWNYISSMASSNLCLVCKRMVEMGTEANQCPRCGNVYHIECMYDVERCLDCGFS